MIVNKISKKYLNTISFNKLYEIKYIFYLIDITFVIIIQNTSNFYIFKFNFDFFNTNTYITLFS